MFEDSEMERDLSEIAQGLRAEGSIEDLFGLRNLPVNTVRSAGPGGSPCAHQKGWRVVRVKKTGGGVGNLLLSCDMGCGAHRIVARAWIENLIFAEGVEIIPQEVLDGEAHEGP